MGRYLHAKQKRRANRELGCLVSRCDGIKYVGKISLISKRGSKVHSKFNIYINYQNMITYVYEYEPLKVYYTSPTTWTP